MKTFIGLVGEPLNNKMKIKRIKGKLILVGISSTLVVIPNVSAQVASLGLPPAANTARSFQDASIARDSNLNQPLNLLNDFYPAITVTIADHDNVRRRPGVQENDLKIVAQPSLGYRTNIGRHQFYAAYNGTYTFHDDFTQEDAESNSLSAKPGLDLTRRWDLDVFASVGEGFEQRGVSGSREFNQFDANGIDSSPETVDYLSYGADLIFGRKIGDLQGVLGYEYNQTGFDSDDLFNNTQASDRDRTSESIHLDLSWRFAAKTAIFGRIQRTETDYDLAQPNLDSDQTEYLIGLRFNQSEAFSGVASYGRTERDFDDESLESFDGGTYYVNLDYSINPFSTISFNASRYVEEPSDENASFYESELFGVSWRHSLSKRVVFNAYAKQIDDDYEGINREDQFVDWGLGLDYIWRSWLTAGVYYGEIDRDSTIDSFDYDDQYIGIRLRSDLRPLLAGRSRSKDRREPFSFGYPKRTNASQ